jgi:5-methylcytosine-specific restriction endonuclease McrA
MLDRPALRRLVLPFHRLVPIEGLNGTRVCCSCGWEQVVSNREVSQRIAQRHLDDLVTREERAHGLSGNRKSSGTRPRPGKGRSKREQVLATYGAICYWCGTAIAEDQFSVEHLVARRFGGTNALANLRPAHRACNR